MHYTIYLEAMYLTLSSPVFYPLASPERKQMVKEFKERCAGIPCKYFEMGRDKNRYVNYRFPFIDVYIQEILPFGSYLTQSFLCPFGDQCWYKHEINGKRATGVQKPILRVPDVLEEILNDAVPIGAMSNRQVFAILQYMYACFR